ncbi:MAG TPA: ATP synthase F1 subunit delta [Tepidisphaeraceae bacterium]|jgi:F-type H+-transporting ATPase subunit delta
MPAKTHPSPTAVTYAQALLDLARQRNLAEPIGAELAALRQLVDDNPTFATFLKDPSISREERTGVIDRAIKPRVNPLLANFLGVLLVHDRMGLLDQIAQAYQDQLDKLLGKVEVDVTVAQRLSAQELEQVRQRVGTALKKETSVQQHVDDTIIGGMILRVEDKLIDASVRAQLETMRRQFLTARPF